jgi:hypothetical protein
VASIGTWTVHVQTRYVWWALCVMRVAKVVHALPLPGGLACSRLLFRLCAFQYRCDAPGRLLTTDWHWMRVPFPAETTKTTIGA